MSDVELGKLSDELEGMPSSSILSWAAKEFFGSLAVTSSFQSQSLPLLHLLGRICPNVPVIFLDTGFHFPETVEFKEKISHDLGINVKDVSCLIGRDRFAEKYGDLWQNDPGMCCYLNKVEPLERVLDSCEAWIAGIRRDQTKFRQNTSVLSRDRGGRIKICPMLDWTAEMVSNYTRKFNLPSHPLLEVGYRSIGCKPCTKPVVSGNDERSGRWQGQEKTECGLHFDENGVARRGNN